MELLPSLVTKGIVSDFFDYSRGPHLRSDWYWVWKGLVKEFWKGLIIGLVGVGLISLGASMEA
jgi:hypothetical protein